MRSRSADPDRAAAIPPLRLSYERVQVEIVGPVATTKVEQSYRNTSNRDLEAEYIFPLPAGASVRDFSMLVGGKRFKGEAVDASAARQTYEDIVRRLQDPGLLEYIGRDLWKVRIYPVPRRGEQKIEISFTSVLPAEGDVLSYQYLLRSGQSVRTTEKDFTMLVRIQGQSAPGPIYSPSHDVQIIRRGDREATVSFERRPARSTRTFSFTLLPGPRALGFRSSASASRPAIAGSSCCCSTRATRKNRSPRRATWCLWSTPRRAWKAKSSASGRLHSNTRWAR